MEEDSEQKPDKGEEDAVKDTAVAREEEEAPVLDLHDQAADSSSSSPSKAAAKLTEVDLMREIENFMDGEEEEPVEVKADG